MPNDLISQFDIGKSLWEEGKYEEAIEKLMLAQAEDINHLPTYYYLGKSLLALHRFDSALPCFLKLIESDEADPKKLSDYYDTIGMIWMQQNKLDTAETHYKLALSTNQHNHSASHNLALLYSMQADASGLDASQVQAYKIQSLALLENILVERPNHYHALHTKAYWLEREYNFIGAIALYTKAREHCDTTDIASLIAIKDNMAECYAQQGHQAYQDGDFLSAQTHYYNALSENKTHSAARYQLGKCYFRQKQFNQALEHFKLYIQHSESAQDKADGFLASAACARENKQFAKANFYLNIAKVYVADEPTLPMEISKLKEAAISIIQRHGRGFWDRTHMKSSVKEDNHNSLLMVTNSI